MKFLADECCDAELVSLLRSEGHDVLYFMEFEPGALDKEVLEKAFTEERILLTEDKILASLPAGLRNQHIASSYYDSKFVKVTLNGHD